MSEYDWSEGSGDELGSPTKMPSTAKKSNLAKSKSKSKDPSVQQKSVRFSTTHYSNVSEMSKPPPLPERPPSLVKFNTAKMDSPLPPVPTSDTPKVVTRPSVSPPPVPTRPPRRDPKTRPISKPNAIIKPSAPPPPPPSSEPKKDKKLVALMDAMDRELAGTEVGKSFERMPKPVCAVFVLI